MQVERGEETHMRGMEWRVNQAGGSTGTQLDRRKKHWEHR